MNLVDYAQLGVAGVSVVAFVVIVKAFLMAQDKRDKRFTEMLNNHINHNTEAIEKNTEVTNKSIEATNKTNTMIEMMCDWFKKNGHS